IQGTLTTKTLNTEEISYEHFKKNTKSMKYYSIKSFKISGIYVPLVMFLGSIGAAIALNLSSKMVLSVEVTFGSFAAFLPYAVHTMPPRRVLVKMAGDYKPAHEPLQRDNNLCSEKENIQESDNLVNLYGNIFEPKLESDREMCGDIEF